MNGATNAKATAGPSTASGAFVRQTSLRMTALLEFHLKIRVFFAALRMTNKGQATTEILSLRLRMTRSFDTRSFDLLGRHFTGTTWGTAFQPRRAIWAGPWAAADGYSTWMVRDSPGSSEM